ncbi:MAG: hypothetical protein E7672_08715 [Ruminococcaceae bacterium]|nr:hypothetical protein [Oscillospiraceae bacterium]
MGDKTYVFDNLNIDLESGSLNVIIWGICAGILIGLVISLICRAGAGSFISSLVNSGTSDPSSAKTIDELSPKYKGLVKFLMLGTGSPLRRAVVCANRDEIKVKKVSGLKKFYYEKFLKDSVPEKIPLKNAKFYLPEENRITAELRYPVEKRPIHTFVIGLVLIIAAAAFLTFVIPELLQMLDNFITSTKNM